ncbi:MAG: zinc-dependent metalloprotease [Candidatus Riflebacteria bacterium]|nr:zinc-dependent metalloprotease [Candidatus Riflebacteria bacterium]
MKIAAIASAVIIMAATLPVDAGPLFSLDPRLSKPVIRTMSNTTAARAHKVVLTKEFLAKEHLYYFAVTATSEASIDMGILSEVVLVKHVVEADEVKFLKAKSSGNPEEDLVASFKVKSVGDKIEVDLSTEMGIRLEGGVYKAAAPARTQDVDSRADRLAYTQVFELTNEQPEVEGAPAKVSLGLRFFLLERDNPGYRARAYPEADRHRLGFFTPALFAGGIGQPAQPDDYLLRRDVRKPVVYTLHPNIPEKFRPAITRGILGWNKVFKAVLGVEPVQVVQGTDPNVVPGDPDVNIVYWFPADVPKMYLGQAHPIADPRTGEAFCSYMLFSQAEIESAVGTTIMGLKIDVAKDAAEKAHGHSIATVQLGRGARRALSLLSHRCHIDRPPATILSTELPSPETVLARTIDWTIPHEAGHSLGLRHNFKSTTDLKNIQDGQFCATVMEYLPPMNAPTEPQGYDYKAIAYGYDGKCPAEFEKDYAYGTDEDKMLDPDTNTYDVGEPLSYLTGHWRSIRRARPTVEELADPGLYLGLLASAVDPLVKFTYVPDDPRHPKAVEFMVGVISDQGSVAATAGGNGGTTSTAPVEEFIYTKNLMERAALMRVFGGMPRGAPVAPEAGKKIVEALESTFVDAPKSDLFLVRILAFKALLSFGKAGKLALVDGAKKIIAYAQANPQAPTLQQEVMLLTLVKAALQPPAAPPAAKP